PGRLAWSGNTPDRPEKRRPFGLGQKPALCPPSFWPVRPARAAKRWRPNHPVFVSSAHDGDCSELPLLLDIGLGEHFHALRGEQLAQRLQAGDTAGCVLFAVAATQPDAADHFAVDDDRIPADESSESA